MNPSQSTAKQELLRRYLRGEVGPREEAELRALAREDDALAAALAGIDAHPEEDHLAALERLRTQLPRAAASRRPLAGFSLRRIAATALLLLAVGGALWYLPQALQQQDAAFSQTVEAEGASAPAADQATTTNEAAQEMEAETTSPAAEELARGDRDALTELGTNASVEAAAPSLVQPVPASPPVLADVPPPPPPPAPQAVETVIDGVALNEEAPAPVDAGVSLDAEPQAGARRQEFDPTAFSYPTDEEGEEVVTEEAPLPSSAGGSGGPLMISGSVTDEDGNAIADAEVRVTGAALGERTNDNGFFSFPGDATIRQLIVEADGFESQIFVLPQVADVLPESSPGNQSSRERSNVPPRDHLALDQATDDEATANVIRLKRRSPPSAEDLDLTSSSTIYPNDQPSIVRVTGGMRALRQAVLDNKPADFGTGRVRVSFLVQANGSLTDFRLRGDASPALQQYVQTYLQQSTEWQLISGDEAKSVSIRFRFE
ncbi:MAG: carboxypeptidase-like regulatory domain-containing protein [Bacteroidota bacterium]